MAWWEEGGSCFAMCRAGDGTYCSVLRFLTRKGVGGSDSAWSACGCTWSTVLLTLVWIVGWRRGLHSVGSADMFEAFHFLWGSQSRPERCQLLNWSLWLGSCEKDLILVIQVCIRFSRTMMPFQSGDPNLLFLECFMQAYLWIYLFSLPLFSISSLWLFFFYLFPELHWFIFYKFLLS